MRYLLKKLILVLPYQFRRRFLKRYALRYTMHEALQQIRDVGFIPDFIIDVGTAGGTHAILAVFRKAFYIWIEPLKEFEPKIQKLQRKFSGDYYICAAGSTAGKLSIHVHPDLVGSSLLEEEDGIKADGVPREIDVITLDSLLDKYPAVRNKRTLLKLDVQGFELEVLDGAANLLNLCEAILLEVSMFKFQKNAPDFYDVIVFMRKKGFVLYDIFDGLNRPLDNALAQKDLLFVKENGFFRQSHRFSYSG
jgi:FkbM family methyltransferase